MAYDVHIVRTAHWTDASKVPIIKAEVDAIIEADSELAAIDITEEFTHRPPHENVECKLDGASLILVAENDSDSDGLALSDEFSEASAACISGGFDGQIRVVSIVEIPSGR